MEGRQSTMAVVLSQAPDRCLPVLTFVRNDIPFFLVFQEFFRVSGSRRLTVHIHRAFIDLGHTVPGLFGSVRSAWQAECSPPFPFTSFRVRIGTRCVDYEVGPPARL